MEFTASDLSHVAPIVPGRHVRVRMRVRACFHSLQLVTRMCDERRQEFILLSDVLGPSMLVIGLNQRGADGRTESTMFGPFFVEGAPRFENGDDLANGAAGSPCNVSGRVLSTAGTPVPGARVDVWQADEAGLYDVYWRQDAGPSATGSPCTPTCVPTRPGPRP